MRLVGVATVVVLFVAFPERMAIEHMTSGLHKAASIAAARSALIETIRLGAKAKRDLTSLKAAELRDERALPAQADSPGAVSFVESTARTAGVALVALNSSVTPPSSAASSQGVSAPASWAGNNANDVGVVGLDVSVAGSLQGLERFLHKLDAGTRLVIASSVSLTAQQSTGGVYDLSVVADAFYLRGGNAPRLGTGEST